LRSGIGYHTKDFNRTRQKCYWCCTNRWFMEKMMLGYETVSNVGEHALNLSHRHNSSSSDRLETVFKRIMLVPATIYNFSAWAWLSVQFWRLNAVPVLFAVSLVMRYNLKPSLQIVILYSSQKNNENPSHLSAYQLPSPCVPSTSPTKCNIYSRTLSFSLPVFLVCYLC
jgi:hypothetical protein